ncbi:MAG TPA: hypothetical protein VMZ29_05280 [Candidatus Bathyarchaeia archaeon]|nr:hypothetical protein [Candidatus Bathyarchaeia archaeon]
MKKLFLTALFAIIFAFVGLGQNFSPQQQVQQNYYVPHPDQIPVMNITLSQIQNGWARMGTTCAGCASYWYQVIRSQYSIQAEDGNYYYYFYFKYFSNSYYGNGNPAGTYLSQVNFYINGNFVLTTPYILCPTGQMIWGAWMRYQNGNATVTFTVTNMNVH